MSDHQLPPSLAAKLATLLPDERRRILDALGDDLAYLQHNWQFWARPDQLPPIDVLWSVWLMLGGRGAGKTRAAAEWVIEQMRSGTYREMAIVGPTEEACRKVNIEGPSGILACSPPDFIPNYESSIGRLVWPNGARAHLFSGEEPQRLRGYNCDAAWVDELCAISSGPVTAEHTWDMLSMCVRICGPTGAAPRIIVTTTPKPWPILISLMKSPTTAITTARTSDNVANLSPTTVAGLYARYGSTVIGRQELNAEILLDLEGALWSRQMFDQSRVGAAPGPMRRVVVAIDPAGGGAGETGIIVAGAGYEQPPHAYVMSDMSLRASPERWGSRAVEAYRSFRADRIVAEKNFGGDMIENLLRQIDPGAAVKMVQASRGKAIRAEPVVALYEQQRVHHIGVFPTLEDQCCEWVPGSGQASPDRLDALVWAVSELLVDQASNWLEVWSKCTNVNIGGRR